MNFPRYTAIVPYEKIKKHPISQLGLVLHTLAEFLGQRAILENAKNKGYDRQKFILPTTRKK